MIFNHNDFPSDNNPFDHDDLYLNQFVKQQVVSQVPQQQPLNDTATISNLTSNVYSERKD